MSVKGLVERAITAYIDSVTEDREPDGMIHPSAASLCARKTVYAARSDGIKEEFDTKTKRKFYIGHRLHEIVQRAIETDMTLEHYFAEVGLEDKTLNVNGHADAIFMHDGKWYMLEIKSINKGSLRYGGMPKEHHQVQAEMYALIAERTGFWRWRSDEEVGDGVEHHHGPVKIHGIKYVYLEKDSLEVYEYDIKFTNEKREKIEKYLTDIQAYVDDGVALPRRLPLLASGKKPWPCNYCPFTEQCYKVDPLEIPLGSF